MQKPIQKKYKTILVDENRKRGTRNKARAEFTKNG
jgi:hypothetical protein